MINCFVSKCCSAEWRSDKRKRFNRTGRFMGISSSKRTTIGTYINNGITKKDTACPVRKRILKDSKKIRLLVKDLMSGIDIFKAHHEGSFIDGCRISIITLDQIQLDYKSKITLRIAVDEQSVNKRGLTIYGKSFANYSQDILARVLYEVTE